MEIEHENSYVIVDEILLIVNETSMMKIAPDKLKCLENLQMCLEAPNGHKFLPINSKIYQLKETKTI